jgi:hypothetical protein
MVGFIDQTLLADDGFGQRTLLDVRRMSNTLPLSAKPAPATFALVVPSDRSRSRDAWFILIAVNISVQRSVCYASASSSR